MKCERRAHPVSALEGLGTFKIVSYSLQFDQVILQDLANMPMDTLYTDHDENKRVYLYRRHIY